MKTRIKGISLLLAVIMTFSGGLGGSTPIPVMNTRPPITQPPTTVPPTTTAPPTTVPPTTTAPPTTVPPATTAPSTTAPLKVFTAHHAFIYDSTNGTNIYTLGAMDDRIYPASITKLFTALVALQHLSADTEVTVGLALNTVPPDSSRAFLRMGDVLTVEQLIYGMLLPSGNDAARVLAAAVGRAIKADPNLPDIDAMAAFVAEMNVQAAAFGMTDSHFVTPDGWHDSNHYTTMADLLTLAQLCLSDPLILEVVKTPQYAATFSGRTVYWKNSNMHLKEDSPFYLPDCIGLKTGYTKAAGRCLLSAYLVDGKVIIAGVFGCPDPTYTYITQFQSNAYLYETYIRP